jgi:predicted transport protein
MATTSGHTNYYSLLDQLQEWREKSGEPVCIVTFNYDLMLEDALPTVGVDPSTLEGYIANRDWIIIKPHGSVNWARQVDTQIEPATVQTLIARAATGIHVGERYVMDSQHATTLGNRMLFPAIAIPLETGKDFECPPEHLLMLEECIRRTTQILIIGWKATERNFLDMLARIMPSQLRFSVHIVCGDDKSATQTLTNVQNAGVGKNAVPVHYGGFSQLMRSEDLRTRLLPAMRTNTP